LTDQSLVATSLLPFASGDIFVPAPRLDPSARFPTGQGAVRQYDANFTLKAEAQTGHIGLISGLGLSPEGVLWALDPQARARTLFGPEGEALPSPALLVDAGFGSVLFLADGGWLLGEHLCGGPGPFAGEGRVLRFGADGGLLATYHPETNGGVGGFLGVTHMALADDGRTLFHVSETGAVVYAHDLVDDRRLGAFHTRTDPPGMGVGLAILPDGRLAVAAGNKLRVIAAGGATFEDVTLPAGRGWANVVVRPSGKSMFVLDFFGGQVAELALPDFSFVRTLDLGNPQGLTSLAEVP